MVHRKNYITLTGHKFIFCRSSNRFIRATYLYLKIYIRSWNRIWSEWFHASNFIRKQNFDRLVVILCHTFLVRHGQVCLNTFWSVLIKWSRFSDCPLMRHIYRKSTWTLKKNLFAVVRLISFRKHETYVYVKRSLDSFLMCTFCNQRCVMCTISDRSVKCVH